MKEILKKYKRQVQIAGGICLIAVLGIGGYVAANQDTAVQTQTEMKKETKSSDQKITKNDTKDAALEKKTDTKKETVKKEDTKSEKVVEQKETTAKKSESADNKSTEKTNKKEEAKTEKESEKTDSKPSDQPESKPEQKPESKPEQKPSKPESKPEQKPSQPESKPEKPQHTHTWQEKTHTVNHPEVGLLWSSIFVTLMANKIGGLQFGIYRNCQISSRVFHTAVAALPLTKANRSDFE